MNDLTDQEVAAFVGKNADYYLQSWQTAPEGMGGAGNRAGFNWAAFFLSGFWLPYRKMYRAGAIFFGVLVLESILEEVVFIGILGKPEAPGLLGSLVGFIAAMICGGFGNAWYLSHTQKKIAEARNQELADDAYLQALAKRGGTSFAASLGFVVICSVVLFVLSTLSSLVLAIFKH
jgi:hypothetical protein